MTFPFFVGGVRIVTREKRSGRRPASGRAFGHYHTPLRRFRVLQARRAHSGRKSWSEGIRKPGRRGYRHTPADVFASWSERIRKLPYYLLEKEKKSGKRLFAAFSFSRSRAIYSLFLPISPICQICFHRLNTPKFVYFFKSVKLFSLYFNGLFLSNRLNRLF